MHSNQKGQLIYHDHSSADFGIYVEYPLTMPSPELDATATHINGRNRDLLQTYGSFKNITLTVQVTVFKPAKYHDIYQLQRAIRDWLVGYDYSYLKFDDNPEWLWDAYNAQANLTPLIDTEQVELTGTITFTCSPLMYRSDGIHYQNVPEIVYNMTNMPALPDWHIIGSGNYQLTVNDKNYQFSNITDEVFVNGDECQAYQFKNGEQVNLNSNIVWENNDAPSLLPGKNIIKLTGDAFAKFEYKPKWRRLA